MRVRGRVALLLLAPALVLMLVLYVVPLGVYLVNGFHAFKDGRILPVWTLRTYTAFFTDSFSYWIMGTSLGLAAVVTALARHGLGSRRRATFTAHTAPTDKTRRVRLITAPSGQLISTVLL